MEEMFFKVNEHAAAAAQERETKARKARKTRHVCHVLDVLICATVGGAAMAFGLAGIMARWLGTALACGLWGWGLVLAGWYAARW